MNKYLRVALTFWFAVPLVVIGELASLLIWRPLGVIALVGLWAMGAELDFG